MLTKIFKCIQQLEKCAVVSTCTLTLLRLMAHPIAKIKTLTRVLGLVFDLQHWRAIAQDCHITVHLSDLLTSVEYMPWTICLPTLVLIAQAVFLIERGQTDRHVHASFCFLCRLPFHSRLIDVFLLQTGSHTISILYSGHSTFRTLVRHCGLHPM